MIKKLRIKYLVIANTSITIIVMLLIAIINWMNFKSMSDNADATLYFLTENEGKLPSSGMIPGIPSDYIDEAPYTIRFFFLKEKKDDKSLIIDRSYIKSVDEDQAITYMKSVQKENKTNGFIDNYRFYVSENDEYKVFYFLNCEKELSSFYTFLTISFSATIVGLLIIFVLIYLFSDVATRPAIETDEKQKRFITNAGHELKTPLSVISANTEILAMEIGENEWLNSIQKQVSRMNQLTKDLILLSKIEEHNLKIEFSNFNITDAIFDVIKTFMPLLERNKFKIINNIEDNLYYNGNEEQIRQMFSLLLDNSIKYSSSNEISITLFKDKSIIKESKTIVFIIENETNSLENGNQNKLFERFYRPDKSRTKESGGSGIGLSIVKTIVETHKGKIDAECNSNKLQIKILL